MSQGEGVDAFRLALGKNIARARKRAGLSQEDLAFIASLHRTEPSLLERGKRVPRADTLLKLAGSLGISVGDFFEGLAWEPADLQRGRFEIKSDERAEGSPDR